MKTRQRKKYLYKYSASWIVMESMLAAAMSMSDSIDDVVKFVKTSNARIAVTKQIGIKIRTKNSNTTHDTRSSFIDVLKSIPDAGLDSDFDRHL
jgi:hypothetical protein